MTKGSIVTDISKGSIVTAIIKPPRVMHLACPDGTEKRVEDVASIVITRRGWATVDIEVKRGNIVVEYFPGVFVEEQAWMGITAEGMA